MLWRRAAIVSSNTSWHSQQHVPSVPSAACTRQSLWLQWHSGSQTLHQRGQRRESQMHCPAAACDGTISHIANPASSRSRSLACRFSSRELLPYPEAIDSYQQLLCDVLHVAPPDAQLILLTSPAVVTLTRAQLSSNWEQLQQLLPVRQQMLVDVFIQLPDLLIRPQDTVAARLHQASEVLQRPVHQLRSKQRRWTPLLHWKLMTMQPQELVQKVLQIQQLLGLHQQPSKGGRQQSGQVAVQQQQWQHVVSLVCDDPRLLGADQAQLLSTVEALEQVKQGGNTSNRRARSHSMQPIARVYMPACWAGQQSACTQARRNTHSKLLCMPRCNVDVSITGWASGHARRCSRCCHEFASDWLLLCLQVCAWPAARLLPGLLQSPPLLMRPAGELYTAASALQQQLKLSEEGLALALKRCCRIHWATGRGWWQAALPWMYVYIYTCRLHVMRGTSVCTPMGQYAQQLGHVLHKSAQCCCMKALYCCCCWWCRAPGALLAPADQLQGLLLELSCSLAVSTEVAADICLQVGAGRTLTAVGTRWLGTCALCAFELAALW